MTEPIEFLTVDEALLLLPFRIERRSFRTALIRLGLCYKRGHTVKLTRSQLAVYIETLKCPGPSTSEKVSGTSGGRKNSRRESGSARERLLARLTGERPSNTSGSAGSR